MKESNELISTNKFILIVQFFTVSFFAIIFLTLLSFFQKDEQPIDYDYIDPKTHEEYQVVKTKSNLSSFF